MHISAIILAAGRGSRLGELTAAYPKCLLEIAPQVTILDNQISALLRTTVKEIIIVTGYQQEKIVKHVAHTFPGERIYCVETPSWSTKNNAASLLEGVLHVSGGGVLQLNSDVVVDPTVITDFFNEAVACAPGEALFCVKTERCGDEEMKALPNETGDIVLLSKKIDPEGAIGEAFGINYFGPTFLSRLRKVLERISETEPSLYFEDGINEVLSQGMVGRPYSIGERLALEVDFAEDLARARTEFLGKLHH